MGSQRYLRIFDPPAELIFDGLLLACCAGLRKGQRKAIAVRPQAMLEAKDLPRCDLSEFLEDRVAKALERDLHMRAQRKGIPTDQVRVPPFQLLGTNACI